MKFSTKTRYAMRAMVEIAEAGQTNGIFQKDIADKQKISVKYLDQIICSLKRAKLIKNVKGKKSGYRLTRGASEINMLDIHLAFEPEIAVIECLSEQLTCEMQEICFTYPFWQGLNDVISGYFTKFTLEDLVEKRIMM